MNSKNINQESKNETATMQADFNFVFRQAQKPMEQRIEQLEKVVMQLQETTKHLPPSSDFISATEVQKRYSISSTTLWRWEKASRIIAKYNFSGKTFYRISQIEKELENGKC